MKFCYPVFPQLPLQLAFFVVAALEFAAESWSIQVQTEGLLAKSLGLFSREKKFSIKTEISCF